MPAPQYDVQGNSLQAVRITGIITVTTAGTIVAGPNAQCATGFVLRAHPANTSNVWILHPGVTKTQGFPLATGQSMIVPVTNLNTLDFDADVNGEKICYIIAP